MEKIIVYHGGSQIVETPEIRITRFNKDFYFGFYCTIMRKQAERCPDESLKMLKFDKMTEEWLDFIAACRIGKAHDYDIVEGPMADDTIFNYVQGFIDGKYSRTAFWELAKFKHPTHQISFHTARALTTLKFMEGIPVYEE